MTRAELDNWCEERDLSLTVMDGFDDCIVGVVERFNDTFVLYNRRKVVAKLVSEGMTHDDAEEWYSFNQAGAWVGEHTPGFLLETEE